MTAPSSWWVSLSSEWKITQGHVQPVAPEISNEASPQINHPARSRRGAMKWAVGDALGSNECEPQVVPRRLPGIACAFCLWRLIK